MPNAAAFNMVPPIRPPLPKADFGPGDPQAPDFAGLLDASTQPPPKAPSPPRNDDSRPAPPPRRADAANDDAPSERTAANTLDGSTDDTTAQPRDAGPADSKAPPQKDAKADSTPDKADKKATADDKALDEKAAAESQAADAIAANIAADAQNVVSSQPVETASATVSATVAAAVATVVPAVASPNDGSTVPAPVLPAGVASIEAVISGVPAALTVAAAATNDKTNAKVATTPDAVSSDADTSAEKFSETVGSNEPSAPKTHANAATANNEKTPEMVRTDDALPHASEADGVAQKAAGQQVSEFTKSLHPDSGKAPSVEHAAAAAKSDNTPSADAPGVSTTTLANNQPATTPVAFGTAALSADGTPITAVGPRASSSDSTTVPVAGLAVEIATRAKDGNKSFDIRLDPPELGRIHVRLDIDSKGNVTSHLLVDRADTYDLLRRDFSGLERALNDAGLKTGDNSLQFTMRDQGFAGDQQRGNQFTNSSRVVVPGDVEAPASAPRYMLPRLGGVDIRV